jgi:hypothetical protein
LGAALSEGTLVGDPRWGLLGSWTRQGLCSAPAPSGDSPARHLCGALCLVLLIADVLSDDSCSEPDRTHTGPSGPAMEPGKVAHPPQICTRHTESRFPLQAADRVGHTGLRREASTKGHRSGHRLAFDHLEAHGLTAFPEALADRLPERAKDGLLVLLWYDDNGGAAIPPDRAVVVPCSHGVVSPSHGLGGSMTGETPLCFPDQRRNGRALSSLTARGGGLPIGVYLPSASAPRPCLSARLRAMRGRLGV